MSNVILGWIIISISGLCAAAGGKASSRFMVSAGVCGIFTGYYILSGGINS